MSSVSTGGGDQDNAYEADGTINTVYIHNWRPLLYVKTEKVIFERNNKGVKLGEGKKVRL